MIALIINDLEYYSKMIYLQKKAIKQLKIFIMTHKDFNNLRKNKIYNIVADDNSQLKNKYNINVIYADKGELYNLRRGYGEMSKLMQFFISLNFMIKFIIQYVIFYLSIISK